MTTELLWQPPRIVPAEWSLLGQAPDGARYWNEQRQLSLIWSVTREADGRLWLHLSVAGRGRLPKWDELVEAKEWLAGTERYAYQVIPPRSRYVNQHPNCLHLFVPLEGPEPLPDFTRGGGSL